MYSKISWSHISLLVVCHTLLGFSQDLSCGKILEGPPVMPFKGVVLCMVIAVYCPEITISVHEEALSTVYAKVPCIN